MDTITGVGTRVLITARIFDPPTIARWRAIDLVFMLQLLCSRLASVDIATGGLAENNPA